MFSTPETRSASFGPDISANRREGKISFASVCVFGLEKVSLGFALVFVVLAVLSVFPKTAFAKSTCLLATADSCELKTDYQGLKIQVDERGKVVVIFGNSKDEFVRAESYVNVHEDLARLEDSNDIEAGESKQIQDDLQKYDGASYAIPDSSELLSTLGFPETTSATADDYLDLIKVHMQLVLSLSASAASYLTDLLGIEAIQTVLAPVQAVVAPMTEPVVLPVTPALVPVPLPSPNVELAMPVVPSTPPVPAVPPPAQPDLAKPSPLPTPAAAAVSEVVALPAPAPTQVTPSRN